MKEKSKGQKESKKAPQLTLKEKRKLKKEKKEQVGWMGRERAAYLSSEGQKRDIM